VPEAEDEPRCLVADAPPVLHAWLTGVVTILFVLSISGPDDVLKVLDGHAYGRFSTAMAAQVSGLAGEGAVLWWGVTGFGRLGHAFGAPGAVARLIESGREAMGQVRWINVLRPAGVVSGRAWDFRWTTMVPDHEAGHEVVPVAGDGEIDALLDEAFPDSSVRPGHPLVIGWYGIRAGGRLAAVAADRSGRPPGSTARPTVGAIGGLAVHPDFRGRGLGKALSAALTTRFVTDYGLSTLGVYPENVAAQRMYESLGYRESLPLLGVLQ
jgi:GNAT superfamily N-acetyltransferase